MSRCRTKRWCGNRCRCIRVVVRQLPLYKWFDKGIKMMGGQAWVQRYIDHLIALVQEGKVKLDDVISHTVPLSQASKMYSVFNNKEDNCVKVVLKPDL